MALWLRDRAGIPAGPRRGGMADQMPQNGRPGCAHSRKVVCMTETTYSIVEARARLGAIAREVSATREPVAITDHGQTVAILVSPADALELQELRALAAYRARQARGEDAGVSHDEAYRRVFGGTEA
ncbi:type II toxin-antitoxin system Phd/YefM family antitoxin [Streptomyces sp. NPDC056820]